MPRRRPVRLVAASVALALAALGLTGCAGPGGGGGIRVVASTSVYGDIASEIGGDTIEVTSIVSSTAQDPHSYEVTARDRLVIETADLVIANGGGYDPFVGTILDGMADPPRLIDAVQVATGTGSPANEHVWYDPAVMESVADAVAAALADLDPDHAEEFRSRAEDFRAGLEEISAALDDLRVDAEGLGVVVTEPLPALLLAAAGFVDRSPEGFSAAIEEGSDVPPALLADVLAAIATGDIALFAYNAQTSGPETDRVLDAAADAGVPVVEFTETLPDDESYLTWMANNIARLAGAIS